ncbi:hypothetical protein Sjap_022987 [Stephania japonica]|uniref:Uncharacterized protein n=1 Tax=Stephania japonica TaxID=461633 RepID=A0AAP0ESH7_9MAGN
MYLDFKNTLAIFDSAIEITFAGTPDTSSILLRLSRHHDEADEDDNEDEDDDDEDFAFASLAFHAIHSDEAIKIFDGRDENRTSRKHANNARLAMETKERFLKPSFLLQMFRISSAFASIE